LILIKRAFERQFRKWQFEKQKPAYSDNILVERVKDLHNRNFSHKSILRALTDFEGFSINSKQLKRLRLHSSVRLLYRSQQTEESRIIISNAVKQEILNGQAVRYGRIYLQTALRNQGILVSQ